jgi:hypothetical protein
MHNTQDENQPRTPFHDHPLDSATEIFPDDEEAPSRGPGCGMFGLIGALVSVIAILIVALAGAAGWTAGQREANLNATTTQNAAVNEQMAQIPGDVAAGNTTLLNARLNYIATNAPHAPGFAEVIQTATALAIQLQPTVTPALSPTAATTTEAEATAEVVFTPSGDSSSDLAGMLQQAQTSASSGQYADAIDWLEAVYASDPSYEAATVRQLLTDTMNNYALQLYNSSETVARANTIVSRMEALGIPLREGLSYERYLAEQFLSAQAAAAAGDPRAPAALQEIINLGPGLRYYDAARSELYDYYVRDGDFVANDPAQGYCPAVQRYQNAVDLGLSGAASGKLSNASAMCAQATPTPDPLLGATPGQPIAPIGVPGT